jgi:arabinan endo-1,5-alpha-L-arabinosidase
MRYLLVLFIIGASLQGSGQEKNEQPVLSTGKFVKIFNQYDKAAKPWYINDHSFIKGPDGKWHMFGITGPNSPEKWDESQFAHAVADSLMGKWVEKPFALKVRKDLFETVLWAPHVIKHGDLYYMFYCGGDDNHHRYQINLAISKDLYEWTRYPGNPLFTDGYDGRDPFIFRDEFNNRWIMYYTATSKPEGGEHIVAARISYDLVNWTKDRYVVFRDPEKGTWGGNTESPFVVQRGHWFYMFMGPGASYKTTKVYKSNDLFNWSMSDEVADLTSHAAEIINDNGKWYISHCGLNQGGLYLAPLFWHDEVEKLR